MTLTHALLIVAAYQVVSSLANSLDPTDKTIFGTVRRFLLLITNSSFVKAEIATLNPIKAASEITVSASVKETK